MNKLKKLGILFVLLVNTIAHGQKIDARLLVNKGELAQSMFKYNTNSYNYLVFELDFGYQVVAKKELSKKERQLIQSLPEMPNTPKELALIGTSEFNYCALGIALRSKEKQFFQLSKNQVLVLLPITEITQLFINHPTNTK